MDNMQQPNYFNKLYVTSVLGNEHGDDCILMH